MNMNRYRVRASRVLSATDLNMPAEQDVAKVVSRLVTAAEGVVAHWVEYGKGVLLFIMAPDDKRSGAFYIYDRDRGHFWLLEPTDGVFGGYTVHEMRRKMRQFRLLEFAANPSRLHAGCLPS
jgi:type IV secretory pathway TrbD component